MIVKIKDTFRGGSTWMAIELDDDSPFLENLWKSYPDPYVIVLNDHRYEYSIKPSKEELLRHTAQLDLFPNGSGQQMMTPWGLISIE